MLAIFRSYRKLRVLLLAAFVCSLATAAEAMDAHGPDAVAGQDRHVGVLSDAASSVTKLAETNHKHGSGHETHCSLDAFCVTGAWSLMRTTSIGLPAVQRMPLVLLPGNEPVKGLRPKPELRPPRADS